jgi:RHS repeat-associated protein
MRPLGRITARLVPLALLLLSASVQAADVVEYYHTDGIGNVRVVTDAAGAVIERHDYLPFGEEWCGTAVCGANRTPGQPLRFTGKERDAETGLDYFGARYYRANAGRFTTVDPVMNVDAAIAVPQKWNRYAYALGNPLRYSDPDGREEYRIVYGEPGKGRYNRGTDFKRAAETKAGALRAAGHTTKLMAIHNVEDLETALSGGDKVTEGFLYFGHGGPFALYIGNDAASIDNQTNLTRSTMSPDVGESHVLGPHAVVELNTCHAGDTARQADPIAQRVADWLGRSTAAYATFMGFSGNPTGEPRSRAPGSGPVYMVPPPGTKQSTFLPSR